MEEEKLRRDVAKVNGEEMYRKERERDGWKVMSSVACKGTVSKECEGRIWLITLSM